MKPGILVVEDDRDLAEALATILSSEFSVHVAHDGLAAWQILTEGFAPRLVLLDVMMPKMSGCELLKRVRSNRAMANLAVALLTADKPHVDTCVSCQTQATRILLKPFEYEDLESLMKEFARKLA
jgi:two-component system, OmpR family, response regulator